MLDLPSLRDYSSSRVVAMGTWEYGFLPPIRAAGNSLQRMVDMLSGPLCGWPVDRVTVLANQRGPGDLPDRLITAFEDITDVALFYYVGHGQIDLDNQLCLGLVGSRPEANRRAATSLPFQAIRRALLDSPAATKIVILDCCFAGLANLPANTLAALPDDVLDMTAGSGAYSMAASGAYTTAWYDTSLDNARPQTFFTRYFVDLVEAGIPGQPSELRLHQLFTQLRDNLARDQRPIPCERSIDAARDFVFAHNAAPPQTHRDLDREVQLLSERLAEAEARRAHDSTEAKAREEALRAEVAERTRELERLRAEARSSGSMSAGKQRQLDNAIQAAGRRLDEMAAAHATAAAEASGHNQEPITIPTISDNPHSGGRTGGLRTLERLWRLASRKATREGSIVSDVSASLYGTSEATDTEATAPRTHSAVHSDRPVARRCRYPLHLFLVHWRRVRLVMVAVALCGLAVITVTPISPSRPAHDSASSATPAATSASRSPSRTASLGATPSASPVPGPIGPAIVDQTGGVVSVAFSPNGKILATAGSYEGVNQWTGILRMWDISNPDHPFQLSSRPITKPTDSIASIVYGPDGRTLLTEDPNTGVVLWDVSNPSDPTVPTKAITDTAGGNFSAAAFSPNGRFLALGTNGDGPSNGPYTGTAELWNITNPAHPVALYGQQFVGYVSGLAFNGDGSKLAIATGSSSQNSVGSWIRIWNVTNPQEPKQISEPFVSYAVKINAIDYRPDGQILALTDNGALSNPKYYLVNMAHPGTFIRISCRTANCTGEALSTDGRTLAISGGNYVAGDYGTGAVRLYNIADPSRPVVIGLFEVNRDGVLVRLPDVVSCWLRCVICVGGRGCRRCGRACAGSPGSGTRMPDGPRVWRAGSGSRRRRS